ncbi:MAG: DUF192 domain-containing protein [Rhodospirillales bacterium]
MNCYAERRFSGIVMSLAGLLILALVQTAAAFETSSLTIRSGDRAHTFTVELARTPEERSRGLMFRESMAADAGMLFDFGRVARQAMWMKNTFIPLDMLFIRSDGTIHHIRQRTQPQSEEVIPSNGRVKAVLELNGGTVERLGIRAGDKVEHPMFSAD